MFSRFSKRRIEDDLESMSRKASSLRVKTEASSLLEKVRQEVNEYRGILKCGVCSDRQKEVNSAAFISYNLGHHIKSDNPFFGAV